VTPAALLALALPSCADVGSGAVPGTGPGDEQTPPTGAHAVDAWLAEGHYLGWRCEPEAHPPRAGSGHRANRICSNDLLAEHGTGEYPIGAASVKELYDDDDVTGYAVTLHFAPGGGDAWYWFERTSDGLIADGAGTSGAPNSTCASCHADAGMNGRGGHDFVYTQVQ
jgi:hypothetical protein